jgi:hypothetical protein
MYLLRTVVLRRKFTPVTVQCCRTNFKRQTLLSPCRPKLCEVTLAAVSCINIQVLCLYLPFPFEIWFIPRARIPRVSLPLLGDYSVHIKFQTWCERGHLYRAKRTKHHATAENKAVKCEWECWRKFATKTRFLFC